MRSVALSLVGVALYFVSAVGAQKQQQGAIHAADLASGFVYPGAKRLGQARGAGESYQAKFTTPDEVGKVADWYREKVHGPGPKPIEGTMSNWPDAYCILEDSRQPVAKEGTDGDPRPVSVLVCMRRTEDFTVSVVVTRAKDERVTHIALAVIRHLKG